MKRILFFCLCTACLTLTANSCITKYAPQKISLSTHKVDFGETKEAEVVTIYFYGDSPENYSASVEQMEANWVSIDKTNGKIEEFKFRK